MDAFDDIDRKLRESREQVRQFEHLASRRKTITLQAREVTALIGELETQSVKEERDVARLEGRLGGFLAGIMSPFSGPRDERLTRERAEAEAALDRLHGQRRRLEELTADLKTTERELAAVSGAPEAYRKILADKERLLIDVGDPRGLQLARTAQKLADTQADLREYGEAIRAGTAAGEALSIVLRLLGKAQGASTWDLFGGGGLADMVEHGHLTRADQAAWHAQRALDVFSRELADIGWTTDLQLPKVDTRWFADTFFDNIITDALKHQRINRTRDAVAAMAQWVDEALQRLSRRRTQLEGQYRALVDEREQLIASY
ncbi:hypothetical protein [Nonomuraea rhizosphaerae]|uniref:hypothetical protein n=1 Tax=Nonomuraea rhizosphaerae TaxID=2665663 RepID=UPI001C6056BF|nr:hypothetical protein [Nonomuraea rhizosphaerae]